MIKAGVFDNLGERSQLLSNLEKILEQARENQKNKANGQIGLFGSSGEDNNIKLAASPPASTFEKLTWEKELLGLYVSSHPLNDYKKIFQTKTLPINEISENLVNKRVIIGGIIDNIKKIITKSGRPMLFLKLEDLTAKTEIVVFPSTIDKNPVVFQENKIVFVAGRVDNRGGELKVVADEVEEILVPKDKIYIN